ncbi:unnamed protein product [Coccothraustes coccothraustes]
MSEEWPWILRGVGGQGLFFLSVGVIDTVAHGTHCDQGLPACFSAPLPLGSPEPVRVVPGAGSIPCRAIPSVRPPGLEISCSRVLWAKNG